MKVLTSWCCGGLYYKKCKLVGIVVVSIIEVLISWGCGGQYYRSVN